MLEKFPIAFANKYWCCNLTVNAVLKNEVPLPKFLHHHYSVHVLYNINDGSKYSSTLEKNVKICLFLTKCLKVERK